MLNRNDSYYKILDIEPTVDFELIRKAYKKLALKIHPDKGGDQEDFKFVASILFKLANEKFRNKYYTSTVNNENNAEFEVEFFEDEAMNSFKTDIRDILNDINNIKYIINELKKIHFDRLVDDACKAYDLFIDFLEQTNSNNNNADIINLLQKIKLCDIRDKISKITKDLRNSQILTEHCIDLDKIQENCPSFEAEISKIIKSIKRLCDYLQEIIINDVNSISESSLTLFSKPKDDSYDSQESLRKNKKVKFN
jgi:hypothetical protein